MKRQLEMAVWKIEGDGLWKISVGPAGDAWTAVAMCWRRPGQQPPEGYRPVSFDGKTATSARRQAERWIEEEERKVGEG